MDDPKVSKDRKWERKTDITVEKQTLMMVS